MSLEQLQGKEVDACGDLFTFGRECTKKWKQGRKKKKAAKR
jgi:hypothetical protein